MELKTEDTGKIFEKAICLLYDIPYVGKYKYSIEDAEILKTRLSKLIYLFPKCNHTSEKGGRYDYTSVDGTQYLSAKTTKSQGKIAPEVIGQASIPKFCKLLNIEELDSKNLKKYIQENIVDILKILIDYTLSCDLIYYNKKKDTIRYIKLKTEIPFENFEYKWTKNWNEWNNSTTLKINNISLLEFQFHKKSRKNMAIRWFFEQFIILFDDYLSITHF
jgi:hypothetical protein